MPVPISSHLRAVLIIPDAGAPWVNTGHYAYYYVDDVSITPYNDLSVSASPNPSCNGVPVTLTASCSTGNGYYTWSASNGATWTCNNNPQCSSITSILPANVSTSYTVTTTLSGFGNCTIYQTINPGWLGGPINTNAGADQTICLGGSATLTGTSAGQYNSTSWAIVGQSTICTGCTTTTVSPTSTTYYVFSAWHTSTGCTRRDTVKVTVVPLSVSIVTPPGATTCNGCFNFTTTQSYSTYSWSSNALTSSCSSCATYNACYGAGWNSPTAPVSVSVVDAQGCQGSAVTYVPICCVDTSYINIVNDSTSHLALTLPAYFVWNATNQYFEATNKTFYINGILKINRNTKFIGCNVKMGPYAKIIVSPGNTFELTSSAQSTTKLYAGCSNMWDGIYVDGANTATKVRVLQGTIIEDALNAIVSTNGGNFLVDGSAGTVKLNKNNIGILVKPYQGTHPGIIRKAIISCDAPGQPGATLGITVSGANCRAPISAKAFAAIYIDSCADITIGDSVSNGYRNLMERQKYGVYAKNSNVKIWNNDFKYYQTTLFQTQHPPVGVAIYEIGNLNLTRTLTVGRQGNYKAHNLIQNCSFGVMVENHMNLNCEYNRLDTISKVGIYTLNNQFGRTILINQDSITEFTGTAIRCTNVFNSTVTITNNLLNETTSSNPTSFGYAGIYVANAFFMPCTVTISNNTIKRIRLGIWVSRVNKATIKDNTITFYPNQTVTTANPGIGIKLEYVYNSLTKGNSISNNITGNPVASSYDRLFGIYAIQCYNDTITHNTMTKCGSGMFLKGSDSPILIGCNTFTKCYYGINFGYSNSTPTIVNISDQIRWGNPSSGTATPTGNAWSGTVSGTDLKGQISPTRTWWCNSTNVPTVGGLSSGSLTNNNQPTTIATADKCTVLQSPVSPISPAEMRDALLSGICKTARTYDTLTSEYQYADSVFAYRTLRENPSWLSLGTADDSYYSNWYGSVGSTNVGILADVEDSIKGGQLSAATSLLTGILPTGTPESNRIIVLGIYLATWAMDNMYLDSLQIVTLTGIAEQGPISGGPAVYDARNMLFQEFNDSSALRMAPQPHTVAPSPLPRIYPNPSNGTLMLNYELEGGQTGILQLYDISGRIVRSYSLVSGVPMQQFDAGEVPDGLYFYTIVINGEAILSEKLVIFRQ
jgi:parallel beta-helix repeat protein